ncbi:ribokinase [Petrotoga sp. 9PW.55.5.1]|uniref:1-phosphofructokinase family hexose kinase n=1 Tax=Petrotoga sp. 9PW.55.5.1 TaxID=1308979 RepID=UPI000DC2B22F|nr:1-phosphofructokinase family hexose kinase [Petrotoga sp. 9PW.55.5.1]RAO99936.1 ribokinase [Petrotoga sp. 9PW.55.5.1]
MDYDFLSVTLNPSLDREVIIENFDVGNLYRIENPSNSKMEAGGKGINVSIMLSDLNLKSIATGFLGGFIGNMIQSKLSSFENITMNFVYSEEESRENIEIIDPIKNLITSINSKGPYIKNHDYEHFLKRYKNSLSLTEHVVISGSIPQGLNVSVYSDLLSEAKKRGKTTYMESIGPYFEEAVINNCPTVVKPDFRRRTEIFGKKLDSLEEYIDVSNKIIEYGARLVIMSYQVFGDIVATNDGLWLFKPDEQIELSHLFGAGDAFMSGILYYIIKNGFNYFEAAKFGMASAISKTDYIEKKIGDLSQIEKSLKRFTVERIE